MLSFSFSDYDLSLLGIYIPVAHEIEGNRSLVLLLIEFNKKPGI